MIRVGYGCGISRLSVSLEHIDLYGCMSLSKLSCTSDTCEALAHPFNQLGLVGLSIPRLSLQELQASYHLIQGRPKFEIQARPGQRRDGLVWHHPWSSACTNQKWAPHNLKHILNIRPPSQYWRGWSPAFQPPEWNHRRLRITLKEPSSTHPKLLQSWPSVAPDLFTPISKPTKSFHFSSPLSFQSPSLSLSLRRGFSLKKRVFPPCPKQTPQLQIFHKP